MFLIDSRGERPVCVSCLDAGPVRRVGARQCSSAATACRAADAIFGGLAETVPELRDHRLRRWRIGCDCERCRKRAHSAV